MEVETILGGQNPSVFVYWGDEDGGQMTDINSSSDFHWDNKINLGILSKGEFSEKLTGLDSGKTYYYRVGASNDAGDTSLSGVQSISTGAFEFRNFL